jgi:hypothetical protein
MTEFSDSAVPGIPARLLDLWAGVSEETRAKLTGLKELFDETAAVAAYLPSEQAARSVADLAAEWFDEAGGTLDVGKQEAARLRSIIMEAADFADKDALSNVIPGAGEQEYNIACAREALYVMNDFLEYRGSSCL